MVRHFLRDDDITPAEQAQILDLALAMKNDRYGYRPLEGPQTVAVIFDKTSTRTRVSFSEGITDLGGNPLIIQPGDSQLGDKESVADTARVLERMVSAIVWRTYKQSALDEMADRTTVPVINSLTDDFHPCQLLADLLTIREHRGELAGLTVAFIGDGASNMAHSYLLACATAGMNIRLATPSVYQPAASVVSKAHEIAAQTGGTVWVGDDVTHAATGADIVVTDTWISMGKEDEKAERLRNFSGYRVSPALMALADPAALFLHCLPAYRGYEVDAEVIDGPQSVIWDEAENRLHAQKALMHFVLTEGK
ncbi:MAG: ornithine carbamoyltransferase [Microbacteriaceae bacterium]